MSSHLIKYYTAVSPVTVYNSDSYHHVATPKKNNNGKHLVIQKGKIVKSLGLIEKFKLQDGSKHEFLILVNGDAVKLSNLELYKDDVDDCGCDGNPIVKPSDLDKLEENSFDELASAPKEESRIGWAKFDKSQVVGAVIGAVIFGAIMWMTTKNKTKTAIGIIVGLILGGVIGRFIGRNGEQKLAENIDLGDTSQEVDTEGLKFDAEKGEQLRKSDEQKFLQIGETYDFSLPQALTPLTYSDKTLFVAKDKKGNKLTILPNVKLRGKLVEITAPQIFVVNPKTGKIEKEKVNKPLPFIMIKKGLFVPLATIEPSSMIRPEELIAFVEGKMSLDDEIYVKGRYAGKRKYYVLYLPTSDATIKAKYGQPIPQVV